MVVLAIVLIVGVGALGYFTRNATIPKTPQEINITTYPTLTSTTTPNNLIKRSGNSTTITVDGVTLEIESTFLPGEFYSSEPSNAVQIATTSSLNPFKGFSIIAAPYGPSPSIEALPNSTPGGAQTYRDALSSFRREQGGTPGTGPSLTLFNQNIDGSYSIIPPASGDGESTNTLIAEWVVEAESRLWIVRISREMSGETDSSTFLDSLKNTTVKVHQP